MAHSAVRCCVRANTPRLLCKRFYSAPAAGSVPQAKQKYIPSSGTYPKGFQAGAAFVGVKASNTKFDDLALIVSDRPCAAAGVFTKNKFTAAPVVVTRKVLEQSASSGIRAVIVNSGCANAVTGKGGIEDAELMVSETSRLLQGNSQNQGDSSNTCVMSTGVIGQRLPIGKITSRIPDAFDSLGPSHEQWLRAARAICTTDTFPKLISNQFTLPSYPGRKFNIAGMTKGAGMIAPNMGTLLGIIATDAPVREPELKQFLTFACNQSFNSIIIDGDCSTNDTVLLLANGAAADDQKDYCIPFNESADAQAFSIALTELSKSLAQLVVRDGEGATKFVTIRVQGAPSRDQAHAIASSIAKSPLVKTALYGKDANWGRILCAIGYAPGTERGGKEAVMPEETSVSFVPQSGPEVGGGELKLLVNGEPVEVDEQRASRVLAEEDLEILVRLRESPKPEEELCLWTCDFSHEYVTINGDYRT